MLSPLQLTPNPDAPQWGQIAQWDRRVWASHAHWSRESRMRPATWSDEEKAESIACEIEESLKYHEATGENLQEIVRRAVDNAQILSEGEGSRADLETIYHRGLRKARIAYHHNVDSQTIEYLHANEEARFDFRASFDDDEIKWHGSVNLLPTDEKEYEEKPCSDGGTSSRARPMDRTAPGSWDVLLMSAPITDAFAPQHTRLEVQGEVIQLTDIRGEHSVARLNLDRDNGRVLSRQSLNIWRGEVTQIDEVQSWRAIDGIEVPELIVSYWTREGSPENYNHRHQLQSVRLNDDVAADALLFPVGAHVEDWRLGAKRIVQYQIEDGRLPSRGELERLRRQQAPLNTALVLGLGAVALAAWLWPQGAGRNNALPSL